MVKSVTSLTRNGLRDWLIQQLTAGFMAVYVLGLVIYVFTHPMTDFYSWQHIFANTAMRVATLLFTFFLIMHAWVGLWTVATDYLKGTAVRLTFLMLVLLALLASFVWTVSILWG